MEQGSSQNNGINNYKGVMLCSRPNQVINTATEKPFCGRVVPKDQLGLVPVKQIKNISYQHKSNYVNKKEPRLQILDRHRKWLEHFKKDVQAKKDQIQQNIKSQQQKFKKIKQQAQIDRDRSKKMKFQYNQTASNIINILDHNSQSKANANQLTPESLIQINQLNQIRQLQSSKPIKLQNNGKQKNKTKKPLWARTQQQIQKHQSNQIDQLLNFFSTNHVNDYAQNNQVKDILSNLKQKIQKLKQQNNWKQKQIQKINKRKQERKKQQMHQQNNNDDKITNFSAQSGNRSVASQKTQQKIQQLKKQKQQQEDWDKFTTCKQFSSANIDQKIAKNIADQILRNYPNMRGVHSNISIRKILQAQAARVINQPIIRPVITTIIKQKQKIDANNLPYLHRNPAI